MSVSLSRAAQRLRRLGYHTIKPYGSAGLSAIYGAWRWHFYSAEAVDRQAAKTRTVRSRGRG